MIRPFTLVCALLAAGSGMYLYQTKHQAQLQDRQIRQIREATEATLTRAGVMRAEYALLNDPGRLEELAGQYLPDLKPTQPSQWTSMSELDKRLPQVGAPTAEPAPLEADPPPMAHSEPAAPPPPVHPAPIVAAVPATAARPESVAVARVVPHPIMLSARPAPPAPAQAPATLLATVRPATGQSDAQVPHGHAAPMLVATQSPPRAARAAVPASGQFSQGAPIYATAAHADPYTAPPATTAEAINRITHGGPVDPSVPVVASALGMARTMMPVSPVGQASAATLYPASTAR